MISVSRSENKRLPDVKIEKILPRIPVEQLFEYKRCYLGISLENPLFEGSTLEAILFWAVEKFEDCLVVVGDNLNRFNQRILHGLDLSKASAEANKLGDSFISKTKQLLAKLPTDKIRLTRWQEHLNSREYKESKPLIDKLFNSNPDFRASVNKDAVSFVQRHKSRGRGILVSEEEAIRLSCEYLLEEIAVFSALSEQGWKVELYPGSELQVLAEVAKGKYQDVPDGLKQRINVELKIC